MSFLDRLKKFFWSTVKPIFPHIRDGLLALGFIKHEGRQSHIIGKLVPGRSVEELEQHLQKQGFKRHILAWIDEAEVLGVRYAENFHYQYHLRVFDDGEIRGHYEVSVESRPVAHLMEWGMEARQEEFLRFLKGWVEITEYPESGNTKSQSAPAASLGEPYNG